MLGRQRAADYQAGHVIERIDELKHLLLIGLVDGGTGVDHVVLGVGAGIEEHVDARDAAGPHGLTGTPRASAPLTMNSPEKPAKKPRIVVSTP